MKIPALPQRAVRTFGILSLLTTGTLVFLQPQIALETQVVQQMDARAAGPKDVPLRVFTDDLKGTLVQGRIWHDLNLTRLQDPEEPGIPDVLVHLHEPQTDNIIAEAITDEDGNYSFLDLPPARYRMKVHLSQVPGAYCPLSTLAEDIHIADEDSHVTGLDLGLAECASLDGFVWEDRDGNGNPSGEARQDHGLGNAVIRLSRLSGNALTEVARIRSEDVASNPGFFHFDRLAPGEYELSVDESSVRDVLSEASPSTPARIRLTLGRGEHRPDQFFGFQRDLLTRKIETFDAQSDENGTRIRWQADVDEQAMGFFIHRRLPDGSTVRMHEHMVVADLDVPDYEVFLPAVIGGEFVIEEMNRDLESQISQRSSTAEISAAPVADGEVLMVQAVDGEAELLTSEIFDNYFVIGFDKKPVIRDLTDEEAPLLPQGESLQVAGDHGVYFSAPPGSRILLNAQK